MEPVNGRRIATAPRQKKNYYIRQPENCEIISYVNDSWNEVNRIYRNKSSIVSGSQSVTYYQPNSTNNLLPNFEPFDLELYWGKKMYQYQNCSENRGS